MNVSQLLSNKVLSDKVFDFMARNESSQKLFKVSQKHDSYNKYIGYFDDLKQVFGTSTKLCCLHFKNLLIPTAVNVQLL